MPEPQTGSQTGPLKLRAVDEEDLSVISAILQDALVPVGEMAWIPEDRRFVLVANRFKWEPGTNVPSAEFQRTLTGLRVDGVTAVKRRGFGRGDPSQILALLAIRREEGAILLDFAGGGSVRLETAEVLCHLDDLGEPWPTQWRPSHPVG